MSMKLPPLPEPDAHPANVRDGLEQAFTEEAIRSYGQSCIAAALEEAARVCESGRWGRFAIARGHGVAEACATAIRAIKVEG